MILSANIILYILFIENDILRDILYGVLWLHHSVQWKYYRCLVHHFRHISQHIWHIYYP